MKVFISWSGRRSEQIANVLHGWLPLILPGARPFITTSDIDKGARWQGTISRELDESNFGIVCLTPSNLNSLWLAFEAGALSKHLNGRVATLLFDLRHGQVPPPMNMFQGTLFVYDDVLQLVRNINAALPEEARREAGHLDRLFPMLWPDLSDPISLILQGAEDDVLQQPQPNREDLLEEAMALLRQQNEVLSSPERFLAPVIDVLKSRLPSAEPPLREATLRMLRRRRATVPDWVTDGELVVLPSGEATEGEEVPTVSDDEGRSS